MISNIVAAPKVPETKLLVRESTEAKVNPIFRMVRIAIAIPLFVLTVCAFLPFALIPVSSQAVINVRLINVRASAAGQLSRVSFELGDPVYPGQPIATLRRQDQTTQGELNESLHDEREMERQSVETAGRLRAAQNRLNQAEIGLRGYSERLMAQWEVEITDARREQAAAEEDALHVADTVKRDEKAVQERIMPQSMLAEAREKLLSARHLANQKTANIERLSNQLSNMKSGYFVGEGVQPPRYLAVRDETKAEITNLREQVTSLQTRLLKVRREEAQSSRRSAGFITVESPVGGIVWTRVSAVGQPIEEGRDILRIADGGSVHVDAWIDRRYGPQLSIGDSAIIYLSGLGKELLGRITAFQGTSRVRLDEENNAIDLQPVHPDQYRVTIQLSVADRNPAYIGQAAKVLFPGRSSSAKARLYQFLAQF